MKAIKQKLQNQRGATLLMALMLLLVVIMVSYIIVNASLSSGTLTAESNPYYGKTYAVNLTISVEDMTFTYDGSQHGYASEIEQNMKILSDGVSIDVDDISKISFSIDGDNFVATPGVYVQNVGDSGKGWVKVTYAGAEATAEYQISVVKGAQLSIQAPAESDIHKVYTDDLIKAGGVTGAISAPEGMTVNYTYNGETTTKAPTLETLGTLPVVAQVVDPNGNYENSPTIAYSLIISENDSIHLNYDETQELAWTGSAQSGTFTVDIDDDKALTISELSAKGITVTYTTTKNTVTDLNESATVSFVVSKPNYASRTGEFTIKIAENSNLTITAPEGYNARYDGDSHNGGTPTIYLNGSDVDPSKNDITVEYSPNGKSGWTTTQPTIKDVGEQTVYVRASKTGYKTAVAGPYTLKVTPYQDLVIKVSAVSVEKEYNGKEQTCAAYELQCDEDFFDEQYVSASTSQLSGTNVATDGKKAVACDTLNLKNVNFSYSSDDKNVDTDSVSFVVADNKSTSELTITPHEVEVTVSAADLQTTTYDGTAQSYIGSLYRASCTDKLYNKEIDSAIHCEATVPSGTDADTYSTTLRIGDFCNTNKNFDVEFSLDSSAKETKLQINPRSITVKVHGNIDSTKVYSGKKQSVEGYTMSIFNEKDDEKALDEKLYELDDSNIKFIGTAKAEGVDKGKYTMGLLDSQFVNKSTTNFDVTFDVTDGYMVIDAYSGLVINVTGYSDTRTYNGADQSISGYTFTSTDSLYDSKCVKGPEQSTCVATGKNASTTPYPMGLSSDDFKYDDDNFKDVQFVVTDGSLTINQYSGLVITVKGKTDTVTYNGSEQSIRGYAELTANNSELFDSSNVVYKNGSTPTASGTNASTTAYPMGLTEADFSYDDSNFEDVQFNVVSDGSLTIEKYKNLVITVTGKSGNTTYNGLNQSIYGYECDSDDTLYDADCVVGPAQNECVATGKDASNTAYPFSHLTEDDFNYSDTTNFENVTFKFVNEGLTINKKTVTITASSQTKACGYTLDTLGTVSGALSSEPINNITYSLSVDNETKYSNIATSAILAVGTYTITPSVTESDYPNYAITCTANTLTITNPTEFTTVVTEFTAAVTSFSFTTTTYNDVTLNKNNMDYFSEKALRDDKTKPDEADGSFTGPNGSSPKRSSDTKTKDCIASKYYSTDGTLTTCSPAIESNTYAEKIYTAVTTGAETLSHDVSINVNGHPFTVVVAGTLSKTNQRITVNMTFTLKDGSTILSSSSTTGYISTKSQRTSGKTTVNETCDKWTTTYTAEEHWFIVPYYTWSFNKCEKSSGTVNVSWTCRDGTVTTYTGSTS